MEPREIVPFTKVLNQLTGPLVGLCGEDKYFGVVGVMDAQVDIEVQLSGYTMPRPPEGLEGSSLA